MKTRVSMYDFRNAFMQSDTYKNSFSYEGLQALFEYLEQYEEETGEEIDFDMVALACEYSEYDSALACAEEYGYEECVDLEPHGSLDLLEVAELEEKQATEWLQERTQVIPVEKGRIIVQQF